MTAFSTSTCPKHCAIARANAAYVAAFLTQDAHGIARHYTPQGRLLLTHVASNAGRTAIRSFWQGVLDMELYCAARTIVELQCADTFGNEVGTYVLCHRDGYVADQGTYVALWQWTHGLWQIRYEVWRSSLLIAPSGMRYSRP